MNICSRKNKQTIYSSQKNICWLRIKLFCPDGFPILNPFKPNGISYYYQLDQSISVLRVVGWYFYSNLNRTICKQTVETDQMSHFAASDLGLHCLPMSLIKDTRLIWVKDGIVNFMGSQTGISNYIFLPLKIIFIFANSVDPDEMPHSAALHCVLHCSL